MRIILNINDGWAFHKGADLDGGNWEPVTLPHTYNAVDGQDGHNDYCRGKAVYRRKVRRPDVPADSCYFLEFEGVNAVAEVFIDGLLSAEHKGGYSTFRVDVTKPLQASPEIEIAGVVDNSNRSDVYPQAADFTFYGGIYRDVSLIAVSPAHFQLDFYGSPGMCFSSTLQNERKDASVALSAWVTGSEESDWVQFVISDRDGVQVAESNIPAAGNVTGRIFLENIHLWQGTAGPGAVRSVLKKYISIPESGT